MLKYIVVELQKTGDTMANIVTAHDTLQDAQYKFYTVSASASISNVDKHSVVLLDENGFPIERTIFEHSQQE